MGLQETLLSQGYTLPGARPNNNILDTLVASAQASAQQMQLNEKRKMEELKFDAEYYKTLRDNKYSPQDSFQAVMSRKRLTHPPTEPDIQGQTEEAKLAQIKAQTNRLNAQATHLGGSKKTQVEGDIMDKVSKGQKLTTGELSVYNNMMKKRGQVDNTLDPSLDTTGISTPEAPIAPTSTGGFHPIDAVKALFGAGAPTAPAAPDPMVPVFHPNGQPGSVPQSKLKAALDAGYRRR